MLAGKSWSELQECFTEKRDIQTSLVVNNMRYQFTKDFFACNQTGTHTCNKCHSKVDRYHRVDVEFFGGDLESLCIKCWIKEVYVSIHN